MRTLATLGAMALTNVMSASIRQEAKLGLNVERHLSQPLQALQTKTEVHA